MTETEERSKANANGSNFNVKGSDVDTNGSGCFNTEEMVGSL